MTIQHKLDQYMDGRIPIAYCKVCSAEGDKLLDECSGKFDGTQHRRMAELLGIVGDDPKNWPIDILDKLIELEKREGEKRLQEEIRKLVKYP